MSNESAKRKNTGTTLAGIAVLIPGLAISAWSLYGYLRDAGAPVWLSVGASASIDGLGLFAAAKAHSFAASGRASRFPRLITYAMVFASIYVNWSHADTAGWPMGIHVLVAVPAAAAAAGFEIIMEETRADYLEKEDPRKRTRRLSKIDFILYLRHPIEVWQIRQDEAGDALDAIMVDSPRRAARLSRRSGQLVQAVPVSVPVSVPDTVPDTIDTDESEPESAEDTETFDRPDFEMIGKALDSAQPPSWDSLSAAEAVRRFDSVLPGHTAREVAEILATRGVRTTVDNVRKVRNRPRARDASVETGSVVPIQRKTA